MDVTSMKNMIWRFRRNLGGVIRGGEPILQDLSAEQRRAMWPPARPLTAKHLTHCKVIESREKLLELMPKNAVCAEIGIDRCDFSQLIMDITHPRELHLVDFNSGFIEAAKRRFGSELGAGQVKVHHGDSSDVILKMPDQYFDWIYIDADHNYAGVKKDLYAAHIKIKRDGLIALNDYIYFAPSVFRKFGVVEAVNEFCVERDFEIIYFALQGRMYNDVVLRRL
jgi:hypothetical protein